ncbi:hypothetical protein PV10_01451 [Exophiala mesophila]|uniref:C2H2-type domain-containing protein n=1 Tax=Exophiala mesophila TaxID=212818 RepID=A0A0D1YAR8_EXOME|nr:uncharacterized protein PV10_01451 [Exophiala mesophila]KIV97741.1 hypothetical protein PV10_01451 [Exophiala mesophila]
MQNPRRSHSGSSSRTHSSLGQTPRTMPMMHPDFLDYPNSTLPESNGSRFSLSSSSYRSRQDNDSDSFLFEGPGSRDFGLFTSEPSTMSYAPIHVSTDASGAPLFSTVDAYVSEPAFDFMTSTGHQWSEIDPSNLSLGPTFQDAVLDQDVMPPYVDMSTYTPPSVYSSHFGDSVSWPGLHPRPFTPPSELELELQRSLMTFCNEQDDPATTDQDSLNRDTSGMPGLLARRADSYSPRTTAVGDLDRVNSVSPKSTIQPRPIRCASERTDYLKADHPIVDPKTTSEETGDLSKARSHAFYEAKVQADGKYHCPFSRAEGDKKCSHPPTQQKCIYNKYLDSHLRPYRCRLADKGDCDDTQFSSAACLFRHEREAHGLWNHGMNPFLCKFAGCERAREGNGFPRKWNRRDHMKRVHEYTEVDSPKDTTGTMETKRRRGSGVPTSTPMKRSDSSTKSKSRALAGAALHADLTGYVPSRGQSSRTSHDVSATRALPNGQYAPAGNTNPRTSRNAQPYPRMYSH